MIHIESNINYLSSVMNSNENNVTGDPILMTVVSAKCVGSGLCVGGVKHVPVTQCHYHGH